MLNVHPTAIVHPGASLADDVTVGPFVIIEDKVQIAEGTYIESNNRICSGTRIGKHCKVMHGAVIGALPGESAFPSDECLVVIGDHTTIREFTTINRGRSATEETRIGSHCLFMATCHVQPGCRIGDTVIIANGSLVGSHVVIDDFAIVGGMCSIDSATHIGKHCMIGGTSAITKDVPPYVLAGREPLSFEGLNMIGLRRRRFSHDVIAALDRCYTLLYADDIERAVALERIAAESPDLPEINEVVSFVASSTKGLITRHHS